MNCVMCNRPVDEQTGCEYIELFARAAFIRDHEATHVKVSYMCSPRCFRAFLAEGANYRQHQVIKTLKESP